MCGRYVSVAADSDLTDEFDVEEIVDEPPELSYNVAPTDPVRVVLERRPKGAADDAPAVRQLRTARWGLVPSWSRDAKGAARMINARIETVTEKPAFRKAAAQRRCLVPALGYYEWQKRDGAKVPHFLHAPDGGLLAFAGLYELWRDRERAEDDPARWLWTCTIITQQATDLLGEIHDRNPVVVPADLRDAWLDCSTDDTHDTHDTHHTHDTDKAARLLERIPEARLEPYVVGAAVGNVRNNGPDLIARVDDPADAEPEQQMLDL